MTDERRDDLLKEALFEGGELSGAEADLVREAEELREVERRIATAGRAEVDALLREGADADLERAAREHLLRSMADGAPAAAARRVPGWLAAGAAAAAVALVLWLAFGRGGEGPTGLMLGTGGVELASPIGAVTDYGSFTWSGELPAGGYWELRIWSAGSAPLARPLVSERPEGTRWIPDEDTPLPDAIRWQVRGLRANGEPVGRADGQASRSSD